MSMPVSIPMLRYRYPDFQMTVSLHLVSFVWKGRMRILYDFPYFLMHIRTFDVIFNYSKFKFTAIKALE